MLRCDHQALFVGSEDDDTALGAGGKGSSALSANAAVNDEGVRSWDCESTRTPRIHAPSERIDAVLCAGSGRRTAAQGGLRRSCSEDVA